MDDIFISILSFVVSAESGHVDGVSIRSILSVSKRWYRVASLVELWGPVAADSANANAPSLRAVSMPPQPKAVLSLSASLQDKMIGFANLGPINGKARLRRVKERATGKIYAVKMPSSRRDDGTEMSSHVLRELALLSRCRSTGALTSQHLGLMKQSLSVQGRFVRWYDIADMSLEDLVGTGRPLSLDCAKNVLRQIIAGVNELHIRGIVHQNLKPRHILLYKEKFSRSFTVRVAGLSSVSINAFPVASSSEVIESSASTTHAPEILLGQDYSNSAADIWAIGCIFAHILRGTPLFTAQSSISKLFQIFCLVGSPSSKVSPYLVSLPYYHRNLFPVWRDNHLGRVMPQLGRIGLDLVLEMLHLDPNRRITAEAALGHSIFDEMKSICTRELRASSATIVTSVESYSYSSGTTGTDPVIKSMVEHLKKEEVVSTPFGTYQAQSDQWSLLVDWIIEVADVFDKSPRSAFLAMQYFHQFTSRVKIRPKRYQLVAAACLHLASASEDAIGIKVEDLVFSADRTYTSDELVALERLILEMIRESFGQPLAYDFVSLYLDAIPELRDDSRFRHLCRYISELALQSGTYPNGTPSQLGASIMLFSLICVGRSHNWSKRMERLCGYSIEMLEAGVVALSGTIDRVRQTLPRLKVVAKRFNKVERERVASIHLPVLENLQDYMDT